ncbi:MAG TPA: CRISPR-associated protein Cas4 [Anaerolineales bacterium]
MLVLPLLLLLVGLVLLWQSSRQRKQAGLPGGRVIYTDTRAWGALDKPLYDHDLGLTGKPDYLVEHEGQLVPVEVKTGRTPEAPYDSHIFQVAAYCLLVEKTYGKRPAYGIIHYPHRDFAVDYTAELESALLEQLAEMRRDEVRHNVPRSHEEPMRCRSCGFRKVCDQRLNV